MDEKNEEPNVLAHVQAPLVGLELSSSTPDFSTSLSSLQSEVDKRFTPKRGKIELLGQTFDDIGEFKRADRVRQCGTFLEFHVAQDKARLHAANFCRDRFCPICNWRRSLKVFSQVSACMDRVVKSGKYQFLFLTLTLRNCPSEDFPQTVQKFFDGWRWLYNKSNKFRSAVKGSFRSLEVTYNPQSDTFHPHLHIVLVVPADYFGRSYIPQSDWVALWRRACQLNYDPIVDVRRFKARPSDGGLDAPDFDIGSAVAEAAKYAVKDGDYLGDNPSVNAHVLRTYIAGLTGRRLVGWTGVLQQARKELSLDDCESGDLVNVDTQDLRDDIKIMLVRYRWRSGAYVKEITNA